MGRIFLVIAAALTAAGLTVAAPSAGAATGTWTAHPTADPGLGGGYELLGVSCTATTACTAVGGAWATPTFQRGAAEPLAERWDGASWTIQALPAIPGAADSELSGVACAPASCLAVGYTKQGFEDNTPREPLALSWNGATWTQVPVPVPAGAAAAQLNGVACPAPTSCMAVGYYSTTALFDAHPYAVSWNGTTWTVATVPVPSAAIGGSLFDVSCADATSCAAVGYWVTSANRDSVLTDSWNGATWRLDGRANPGSDNVLSGVSCYSHTGCDAVGSHDGLFGGNWLGFAERRSAAGNWSAQTTPGVPNATVSEVWDVSCVSASNCVGIAFAQGRDIANTPYAVVWNGFGWKREYLGTAATDHELTAISCPTSTYCMSVGQRVLGMPLTAGSATRTS